MFPTKEIEKGILLYLERNSAGPLFNLWFRDLSILSMNEEKILFRTSSAIKRENLLTNARLSELISSAIMETCAYPFSYEVIVGEASNDSIISPTEPTVTVPTLMTTEDHTSDTEKERAKKESIAAAIEGPSIIKEYTFDNFIVGESNKFAHAACRAVANRDESYNPLFIYGQSGLGKTHLLYAITNQMKENAPSIRIVYKKGDDFTNELVLSIQGGTTATAAFRDKYRSADVLLIDDIQFIAGKEATQEEFFHTFSALYEEGKQIILTSDRPPKEIKTLEERLRTRFEWGLIADIQPPSFELRTAIIRKKAEALNIVISMQMVEYMAEKLQNNIRQIEGALKKLSAYTLLYTGEIDEEKIRAVVAEFSTGIVSPEDIVKNIFSEIYDKYGVTEQDIKSGKRTQNIANVRHITAYLIKELTDFSLSKIGKTLNRDHTTILSSIANIEEKIKKDPLMETEINEMISNIRK